jgi:photosystem II stability/assembly factor-like uncharacterized protein
MSGESAPIRRNKEDHMNVAELPHRLTLIVITVVLLIAAEGLTAEPVPWGAAHSGTPGVSVALSRPSPTRTAPASGTDTWSSYPLFGGEMTSIATHPAGAGTAWVGTRDAGVFKTVDGGQTWTPSSVGLTFYPIRTLVVDPVVPTRLYAGTDFDGVWKSIDGGATWFDSGAGIDDFFVIFNIVLDPSNTEIVYASGFGGVGQTIGAVYRSTNGGATWTRADSGIEPTGATWVNGIQSLAIDPDVPTTLYAGTTYEGIFRTTNGGSSWIAVNDGVPWLTPPDWRKSIDALTVDHHHGGRPSSVISTVDYYVLDPSDVWQPLSHDFLGGRRMAFHPSVSDTVMMAGASYVWSTDGGLTWSDSGPGTVDFGLDAVDSDTVFGARKVGFSEPGGVYRSIDAGETWVWAGDGITGQAIRSVAADPDDPNRIYAGTGHGFLYRSVDGGETWSRAFDASYPTSFKFGFEVLDVAVWPTNPERVFLTGGTSLYRSLDGAVSFTAAPTVDSARVIEIAPDGTIYVGCSFGYGIFKSTDGGDSWLPINTGLPIFGNDITPILSLAVDPNNYQTLWAGTQFGGGIVKSTDGGATWQVMGLTDDNFVYSIAVNPEDGNDILAGGGFWDGALYRSTDGGQTWTTILDGIAFVHDLLFDPLVSGHVYAATEGQGVLRSINGGVTWGGFGDGIFYPVTYSIDLSADRRLITGSYGSGLYWTELPELFANGFEGGGLSAWSSSSP